MNLNPPRKGSSPAGVLDAAVDQVILPVSNPRSRMYPVGLLAAGISTQDILNRLLGSESIAEDRLPFLTPEAAKRRAADEDADEEADDDEDDEEESEDEEEDEDLDDDEDDEDEDDEDEDDEDEFDDPDDDDDFDDDDDDDFDDDDE